MAVLADDTFADRYALGEVLGSGGSGVVRLAHDTVLDRQVAIKLLRAGADDDVLRQRLRAEAQLAGALHHPAVAQIYDYGEADADGDPTPYIVMQYVEGTSLSAMLRERRTLPEAEVLDLLAQLAAGLQAAHDAGIIHRDLKPSNVLVTEGGRAVLVDFGIARTFDADPLTMTGTIVGTADYVSPEQCRGQAATPRSDLYSLGMLAYECLTGHKPFHRESPVATALAHLNDEAPPLTDVSPSVAALVAAMIAKDPADRPETAADVARRAAAMIDGPATSVMAALPDAGATSGPESSKVLPPAPTPLREAAVASPPWRRRALRSRRMQVAVAAVAVTLLSTAFVAARPSAAQVPDLEGMGWAEARVALDEAGLEPDRQKVDSPNADKGAVLGQDPAPGREAEQGATVTVRVASGRTTLEPGDVVGLNYEEAARALVGLGLVPVRAEVERPGADGATVVTAVPHGRLETGSTVTLNVGIAPEPTPAMAPKPSSGTGHGKAEKSKKPGEKPGERHGKKH